MELLDMLRELTAAFGPSGSERGVRQCIETFVKPLADEVTTDTMGNLIVHKKGNGPKVMFSAHMDSIGMIVTHIEENGWLRFGALGGLEQLDLRRQSVVFENGTRGVIGVPEDKEEEGSLKLTDLYIDIGASSRDEAMKQVRLGDSCVYDAPFWTQNGKVFSRYLDNRSGCAVLIRALEQIREPENDLYFVFSVQEEVGTRGVRPAAFGIDPDVGIAVDVTCSDDLPGSTHCCSSVLGKGSAVKLKDGSVICQPEVVSWMNAVAAERDIPIQQDVLRSGGTDAGGMLTNRLGVYTGGICIPCRYTHAPMEVCDLSDIESGARFAAALAESEFTIS